MYIASCSVVKKSTNIDGFRKAEIIDYSVGEQAITYASDESETYEERFEYNIMSLFNFDTEEEKFLGLKKNGKIKFNESVHI